MISKKDITKFAKRIIRSQQGLRDHQMIHPQREWGIGLGVGVVALIGGAVWSYVTYGEVRERDVDAVNPTEVQQTVYQEGLVNAALSEFRQRKVSYEALLNDSTSLAPVVEEFVAPEEEIEPDDTEESQQTIDEIEVETEESTPEAPEDNETAPTVVPTEPEIISS